MTVQSPSAGDAIAQRHDQFMTLNYPRYGLTFVRGEGSRLFDPNGRAYVDLFAGFGAAVLGHCHPDLVDAVSEQARKLWHAGNLVHTEPQTQAAEAIGRAGFGGRSFFCHSGADANEAAIKLARLYGRAKPGAQGPRWGIITADLSFHGRTLATMMATGQAKVREGFEPWPEGFSHVPYNDIKAVESAITPSTVAIMVEPIQGEGGIRVPDPDYLSRLRALCDQHDLLLIIDEVWTGCGRTGRYFGHQHFNVEPDIMTLGKGVGGGLPVGVMCSGPRAADLYDARKQGAVRHATTLGGNCLAMAVTARIFQVIERDGLLEHAANLGRRAMERLEKLKARAPWIGQVRGKGLFVGIELDECAATDRFKDAGEIVLRCQQRGVLIGSAQKWVVRLAPAINIESSTLDEGMDVLEDVLAGK
ncbi:MAG: acetylornithine transaminase [Phycisphaeraceae bacterium]|nr:acetylornithine transaminase [Phycisphaeraceae bacterium]